MKQQRTLIVLVVAVVTAGVAAFAVYKAIQRMPVRQVEVASVPVVVAARTIPVGVRLTTDDVRVAAWPAKSQVPGAFADPKQVIDRGVIETLVENEPITDRKVAGPDAGAGLPPIIPAGMRAMSVRVNEVIGVAGYVVPGTRVDVLVSVRDDGDDSNGRSEPMARTVVSNVQVLSAGTNINKEEGKEGKHLQATVVTVAVTPEDAERIVLASNEGNISLALRNPMDVDSTQTTGVKLASLMRGTGPAPAPVAVQAVKRPAPRPVVVQAPPPPPPPPPAVYKVETIRAAKRSEEVID
jgi:pilus assembly protein CpaB